MILKQGEGRNTGGLDYLDRLIIDFSICHPKASKAEIERAVFYMRMAYDLGQEKERSKANKPNIIIKREKPKKPVRSIDHFGRKREFDSVYQAAKLTRANSGAISYAARNRTKYRKKKWEFV